MQQADALKRERLEYFVQHAFRELNPSLPFVPAQHITLICDYLERIARGELKRLIINIPPRYGKSTIVSVAFVAWMMGHDPTLKFLVASYGEELANKLSRDFRAVVTAKWFHRAFPRFKIDPTKNTEAEIQTTELGLRKAISLGGAVTGLGGDVLIVDDPMKAQ